MTCDELEQTLLDSSHSTSGDGWVLRVSKATLIENHVQNCPACATKMAEASRLEDALGQLRISTLHLQAPPTVEKNLLAAFRQQTATRRPSVWRAWRPVWVAAAVLILAAVDIELYPGLEQIFGLKSESAKNANKIEIHPSLSPRLSGAAAEAFNENRGDAARRTASIPSRHVAEVIKAAHERVQQPPLVPTDDELALNGGGSVVRVTLPVSSLVAVGVPVGPDLSDGRVTADVWMDPFGAVVGIRLVAENRGQTKREDGGTREGL